MGRRPIRLNTEQERTLRRAALAFVSAAKATARLVVLGARISASTVYRRMRELRHRARLRVRLDTRAR